VYSLAQVQKAAKTATKSERKATMRSCVESLTPVGILAYDQEQPIAWCSVAPRHTYRALNGFETDKPVWSIACFFIKRSYRDRGIQKQLIEQAIIYARENGAHYVEAYPVEKGTTSYRFMGYKEIFEKAGFQFITKKGKRRNVMLIKL